MRGTDALPSPGEERDALASAARAAGEAILPMFRDRSAAAWIKGDDSPVSEADLLANTILREALITGPRSGYGWLSEESRDDEDRLSASRTLIVDPIDGTRAFLQGDDGFTVCLAVVEAGRPVASVVFAPAKGELFAAADGQGASLNGQRIGVSGRRDLEGATVIGRKKMYTHPGWPEPWPGMRITYRPSTSYRLAMVAAGRAEATVALAAKADWDAAPGALIAAEAGAKVSDHLGGELVLARRVPKQRSLVCAAPGVYPEILRRLAHLPADLDTIKP